jgi:protein-disulfide isomerase
MDAWLRARATQKALKRDWAVLRASPDRLGTGKDVVAVGFFDFECPYCAAQWPKLDSLLATHPDAAIAIRHLPLPFHAAAEGAARATICAEDEGKFAAVAVQLLTHKDWRTDRDWSREALSAGVSDIAAFNGCLQRVATSRRLREDSAFAFELGISGTPTFVFQDRVVPGLLSQAQLDHMLSTTPSPRP